MDDADSEGWIASARMAAGLALLLLSPLGAPLIGLILAEACDIPWEGDFQCAVPTPLIDCYFTFAIVSLVWAGPFILWLMASTAVLLGCIWLIGRVIWHVTMERP